MERVRETEKNATFPGSVGHIFQEKQDILLMVAKIFGIIIYKAIIHLITKRISSLIQTNRNMILSSNIKLNRVKYKTIQAAIYLEYDKNL